MSVSLLFTFLVVVLGFTVGNPTSNFKPPKNGTLPKLKPHPRLLATDADFDKLKTTLETDRVAQVYYTQLVSFGEEILAEPTNNTNSRKSGHMWQDLWYRIVSCGMLWRITGNTTWAAAGIHETNATGAFPNWGGATYLEVAGLTYASAIGFDWFYSELSTADREYMASFMVAQGLNMQQYDKYNGDFGGFTNRNIVANGCYLLGALAVWEEEPELAASLWDKTTTAMQNGLSMYAGGGWWEGWVYWGYATEHTISIALTLNASFGTDFGFSQIDGLADSGDFMVQMFSNATGHNYAYADAGPHNNEYAAILLWHNRLYPAPHRAYVGRLVTAAEVKPVVGANISLTRYPAWSLLFWDSAGTEADLNTLQLVQAYPNISTVLVRSNWSGSAVPEQAAALLSFKGGGTYWSHNHRDLGSFAFESRGVRWVQDLGLESYAVGGADNTHNYRIKTIGHNTLTFGAQDQPPGTSWCVDPSRRTEPACKEGTATIELFSAKQPSQTYAILDLSHANVETPSASEVGVPMWKRGFAVFGVGDEIDGFVIVDEFNVTRATNVTWGMHTHATITSMVDTMTTDSHSPDHTQSQSHTQSQPSSQSQSHIQSRSQTQTQTQTHSPSLSHTIVSAPLGDHVQLFQNGSAITVAVLQQATNTKASFSVTPISFPPPLLPDPGVQRVQLLYDVVPNTTVRLVIAITSGNNHTTTPPPHVRPLADWSLLGPFV